MKHKNNDETPNLNRPAQRANSARRRVLLGSLGGAAAVSVWHTPVIKSVMLPAHAQTSLTLPKNFFRPGGGTPKLGFQPSKRSLLDVFIPAAHAGKGQDPESFGVLATNLDDTSFDVQFLNNRGNLIRTGTLQTDGTPGTLVVPAMLTCAEDFEVTPGDIPASITAIDQMEMTLRITPVERPEIDIIVPAGPAGVLEEICRPE